jgi:hypothetical protein
VVYEPWDSAGEAHVGRPAGSVAVARHTDDIAPAVVRINGEFAAGAATATGYPLDWVTWTVEAAPPALVVADRSGQSPLPHFHSGTLRIDRVVFAAWQIGHVVRVEVWDALPLIKALATPGRAVPWRLTVDHLAPELKVFDGCGQVRTVCDVDLLDWPLLPDYRYASAL